MYTAPSARGRGVARAIVGLVEAAGELGYERVRVETGSGQPDALGLYRGAGFAEIRAGAVRNRRAQRVSRAV